MNIKRSTLILASTLIAALTLSACGSSNLTSTSTPTRSRPAATLQATPVSSDTPISGSEQPLTPEQNPVGDIPDNQAFITYTSSSGGYYLEVPEGWARTENGTGVDFNDKLNNVQVQLATATTAPTAADSKAITDALTKAGRAVQVGSAKDVQTPAGTALLVAYTINSEPNAVTGKQVRLEANNYYFFKNGKLATLVLTAPLGADNVDQWQRISQSFGWQ